MGQVLGSSRRCTPAPSHISPVLWASGYFPRHSAVCCRLFSQLGSGRPLCSHRSRRGTQVCFVPGLCLIQVHGLLCRTLPPGLGVKTHHPVSGRAVASGLRSVWPPRASSTPWCCSSLGEAWAQVKKSLADEAEVHLKFSAKVSPPWVGPTHPCAAERLTAVSAGCGVVRFPWCISQESGRDATIRPCSPYTNKIASVIIHIHQERG